MKTESIIPDILRACESEKDKHPYWPQHIVASAGIVSKEAGSLLDATLETKYNGNPYSPEQKRIMKRKALQTAAAALLFIENL